jgi:hypothetical protein
MVDVKALKAKYKAEKAGTDKVFAVVLGKRGDGKSGTAAGTWGEDKVILQLIGTQEDHGQSSACGVAKNPDNIISVMFDMRDGKMLPPAESFDNLLALLTGDLTGVDVVVLDGLSVVDTIIQNHPKVLSAKGYDSKKVADLCYDQVLCALKGVSLRGKDVVITCPTELRANQDGYFQSPSLRGGSAINVLIGACPEVLVMGRVETEAGLRFVFDFDPADVRKSGKKASGDSYILAVEPRLAGVPADKIPTQMAASFAYLKKFKKENAK